MKLMRVGEVGYEVPVVQTPEGANFDLSAITGDFDGAFFAGGGLERVAQGLQDGTLPSMDISGQRIGAPIARPSVILCVGMNYAAHAAESGAEPPTAPVIFYKAPNTLVGPNDDVLVPRTSTKTDWEVELAVVIGKQVRYLDSPDQALEHVAGYAIANDVSERTFQIEISGGQWSKGKSCETFNPLGPWLATTDEIPDPQVLQLRSFVNGEPRQDSNTRDMIFSVATILYELSQVTVLEPGDLILTGTPEGVALSGRFPFLSAGDLVELDIEGLGSQQQNIKQA